ncbi:MAG: hypothetical protein IKW28_09950 [Lachnospiraceae bacterium]|nr:hypothetical protein [Lachnospiraceae bacterium]
MEKTEAVSRLRKAGYQVQFDSSVVTVLLPKKVNMNSEIKKVRSFLRELGYEASFGVRQRKTTDTVEEDSEEAEVIKLQQAEITEEVDETKEEFEDITDIEQFSLEDFGVS